MTWEAAWKQGRTGWDAGEAAPALLGLLASAGAGPQACRFDQLLKRERVNSRSDESAPIRVLVPGAGAGYDVLALAAPHRQVLGLDLAPTAKQRFDALLRSRAPKVRERLGTDAPSGSGQVAYWVADFFALSADTRWQGHLELFDAVWDYTFFCALQPAQRPAWARAMAELIRPGGALITLMFPLIDDPAEGPPVDRDQGPPFPLTQAIYEAQLLAPELIDGADGDGTPCFRLEHMWPAERSHPGREGKEKVAVWRRLTRTT